jgi:hypothetical protein
VVSSLERIIADIVALHNSQLPRLLALVQPLWGSADTPETHSKAALSHSFFSLFPLFCQTRASHFNLQLPLHLALSSAHYSPIIPPMQLSLLYVLPILVFLVLCMIWAVCYYYPPLVAWGGKK